LHGAGGSGPGIQAFQQGNYRDALRLASHAAVDSPRNARVHELLSLPMFALKDYRGAAMEAHAAV
jgi:Flp pilus assembly protein TadD